MRNIEIIVFFVVLTLFGGVSARAGIVEWDYVGDPRITNFRIHANGVEVAQVADGDARSAEVDLIVGETLTCLACSDTYCSLPSDPLVISDNSLVILITGLGGQFEKGTTSMPVNVTTSETTTCRFSKGKGNAWQDMNALSTSDGLEHSANTSVADGEIGQICSRCMGADEVISEETCSSYYIESQPKNPVLMSQVLQ